MSRVARHDKVNSLTKTASAPYTTVVVTMLRSVPEVCATFLELGLTSFGGPIAHLGYIRRECVEKRRWLSDDEYADIVALCQFLPGPASSQVVFALGMHRAGFIGAVGASVAFLLPSAFAMIAFAYGVAKIGDLRGAGWLHGLKLAAVAVVAQAVWAMGVKLCPDRPRITIALLAAACTLCVPGALGQIGVLLAGALAGWLLHRSLPAPPKPAHIERARGHLAAVAALLVFGALLFVPRIAATATGSKALAVFDGFYRPGALVFGGGHVVLPLLREAIVPRGWISDDAFLAGYGAAQAVPGPLFSFAGFLGAAIYRGKHAWLGGIWCLFAIFLPSWLLISGAFPFWHQVRAKAWMQAALRGANAAVVGILLSALYSPVITEGVRNARDVAAALVAFGLLQAWKAPPWAVVLMSAAAGQWLLIT
ncbi:MAG TPA: chromate efflux transporter [Labilithrix sp.]|jgi:chromate transporter|nr:chromate efflux transporter [Labilithrix sp.]